MRKKIKLLFISSIIALISVSYHGFAEDMYLELEEKVSDDIYKTWTITFNEEIDPTSVNEATVFVVNQYSRSVPVSVMLSEDRKRMSIIPSQMYVPEQQYKIVVKEVVSISNEKLSPLVKIPFVIQINENEGKRLSPGGTANVPTTSNKVVQEKTLTNKQPDSDGNNNPFGGGTNTTNHPTTNQQSTAKQATSNNAEAPQPVEKKPEYLTEIKVDVNPLVSIVTVKTSNFVASVKIDGKRMHYQGKNVYELSIPNVKSGQTLRIEAYATYENNSILERINHLVK